MADVNITPNMNLPNPVPSTAPGPGWAQNLEACNNAIDSHNHSAGQGVQVTPDGININTDLPFNDQNATTIRSANFSAQGAPLSLPADIGCLYVSGDDLYYNDENGNQVRITQGGAVAGSAGTITGLPSGTASASFAGGTFTFQSSTNTPATMAVGPLAVGAAVANSKTVTIAPSTSLAANYAMTLPAALPVSTSIMNVDSSGSQGLVAPDGSTFGVSGGAYKVLDGGINTTQLAASSVTTAKIADSAVTNEKLAGVNYSYGSSGSFLSFTSASYANITGLGCSITGVSRPVLVMLTTNPTDLNSEGYLQLSFTGPSGFIEFKLLRNGVGIAQTRYTFGAVNSFPPSWVYMDPSPPAGLVIYQLQGLTSDDARFHFCALLAMEL